MNRFSIGMLTVAVALSAMTIDSMAQSSKVDDPFRFELSVSAEVTDNRDSSEVQESNIDYYIGPKFIFKGKPGDASLLTFTYNPIFRHRTEPSLIQNEGELYHYAKFDLRKKSSEIQETRVINQFNYTDDPAVTQGGTLLRRDSSYIFNYLEIGTHKNVQKVNTLDIYGLYTLKRFDESEVADQSDEDRYSLNLLYLRQYQRKSALALELQVGGTGYKELAGLDRSFMTAIGAVGIEHIASPSMRMGARLGVQFVDYADEALGNEATPMVNLSFGGNTIPTVAIRGSLDHRVRESDVFPFAAQEATDLKATIDWTLKERNIVLTGSAIYHTGSYSEESLPSGGATSAAGDETSTILEVGGVYKHTSATEFGIRFRSEEVDSDSGVTFGRNFSRNATTISVSRQF